MRMKVAFGVGHFSNSSSRLDAIDLFEKDSFLFVKRALPPFCFCNVLAGFQKQLDFGKTTFFVYERTFKPKLGLRCFVYEFVCKCKCFDVI